MLGEKHIYTAAKLVNILYTLYNLKETIHLHLKKLIVLRMSLIYLLFQPDLIGGPKALNWNHLSKLIFKQQYSKKNCNGICNQFLGSRLTVVLIWDTEESKGN